MGYSFQSRLNHASRRFKELNRLCMTYIVGTVEFPISASPILINSDEIGPGVSSLTRIERQDFGIDKCDLGDAYPPAEGHRLRNNTTGETYIVTAREMDTPPYVHVTSDRNRLILHTVRSGRGS